jgi:hypothetical protein
LTSAHNAPPWAVTMDLQQAHSDAALVCRVEGFKNPLEKFRIDAGSSRIVNCDEDVCGSPLLGDDRQHSLPLFD